MNLCFFEFRRRQAAGLAQYVVRYCQFADVVEQCARAESINIAVGKPKYPAQPNGVDLCSPDMPDADLIAGVDRGRQSLDCCQMQTARLGYLNGFLAEAVKI